MLEDNEFYELFPPHMHYYVVERTQALSLLEVDHLRVVHDRRIYIATDEEVEIVGLRKLVAPEPPSPEVHPSEIDLEQEEASDPESSE